MLSLSQTTGYAVHALAWICQQKGEMCKVSDVAKESKIPKPYLSKIISILNHHGLVSVKRGRTGGVSLSRAPEGITLLEVVEAVEGTKWIGHCMLGLDDCASRRICPTKLQWEGVREHITTMLKTTNMADVMGVFAQEKSAKASLPRRGMGAARKVPVHG